MLDTPSPILGALPDPVRALLLARAVVRDLAPGDLLCLAGEPPRRVHVVTAGLLKLSARDAATGADTIVGLALPGDLVGEVAAVDERDQPFDVEAAGRARVLGFDARALCDAVTAHPAAARALAAHLSGRVRWLAATSVERVAHEGPVRLAARLLELALALGQARDGAIEFEMPLRQDDLARLAGMTRETTCRALRSFRAAGLLDYRGRAMCLLQPELLDAIRCGERAAPPSRPALAAARRRTLPSRGT